MIIGVVPKIPPGPFLAIMLLEREGAPPDLEIVAFTGLDLLQPNCCLVDMRSDAVEVDVDLDALVHRLPLGSEMAS